MEGRATRDSTPVRMAGHFLALMSILFAALVFWLGDIITSKQWQYLMGVPGGKYSWMIAFGISGIIGFIGLRTRRYNFIVAGMCGEGFFCILIAVFYALLPLTVDNIITLGSWPWVVAGGAAIGVGAMNRNDSEW